MKMGFRDNHIQLAAEALGLDPSTLPSEHDVQPPRPPQEHLSHEDLTDEEWNALSHLLPDEPRQRNAISNRQVIDALLWLHETRRAMTQLPERYGTSEAVRKRSERWAVAGVWQELTSALGTIALPESRLRALRRISEQEARRGKRIRKSRSGG